MGRPFRSPSCWRPTWTTAPDELRGFYMSLFQMTGAVAFGIGPGVAGLLFDFAPMSVPVTVACCVTAGAFLLYLGEGRFPASAQRRAEAKEIAPEPLSVAP